MASRYSIQWDQQCSVSISNIAELDEILDRLSSETTKERPILVEVISPTGDSLSIGIGSDMSILHFVTASGDPPYYASVGDEDADDVVVFEFRGEFTEYPRRQCIPTDQARQVVREFVDKGTLSRDIRWEEV